MLGITLVERQQIGEYSGKKMSSLILYSLECSWGCSEGFIVGTLTNFLHWSGASAGTAHFATLKTVLSGTPFVPQG